MTQQSTNNGSNAPASWSEDPSLWSWAEPTEPRTDSTTTSSGRGPVPDETQNRPAGREAAGNRAVRAAGPPTPPETDPSQRPPERAVSAHPTPASATASAAAPGAGPAPKIPSETANAPVATARSATTGPDTTRAEPASPDEAYRASAPAEPVRGQAPIRPTTIPPATPPPMGPQPSGPEVPDPAPRTPGLSHETLARRRSERPTMGWRAALYALTGLNPGPSEVESRRNAKIARIKAPLPGCFKLAVVSLKGGVGKTTTTGLLGLTLAEHRGDRAIALDANPDAGTLAERLLGYEPQVTVRDLLANIDRIETLTHVDPSRALSGYTALAGRLHVLASEQDPAMSEMFNSEEYAAVSRLLSRFYNIILTDSGTGLVHSAMQGTLDNTHSLVIVGAPTVDGASRAAKTLDYLAAHGFEQMVRNAVVALSCDRHSDDIKRDVIVDHFAERVRAVVEIPADRHLAMGGMIDLRYLAEPTRDAALDLAAAVTDAFNDQHHVTQSTASRSRNGHHS